MFGRLLESTRQKLDKRKLNLELGHGHETHNEKVRRMIALRGLSPPPTRETAAWFRLPILTARSVEICPPSPPILEMAG